MLHCASASAGRYRAFYKMTEMKKLLIYITLILASCGQVENKATLGRDSTATTLTKKSDNPTQPDNILQDMSEPKDIATFYVVTVAEGFNYDSLKTICLQTAKFLDSKVDLMGRVYRENKGIILPDNCDDIIYCGNYYPRRPLGEQNFVSIEMKSLFSDTSEHSMSDTLKMVVVANMFFEDSKQQADSVTKKLHAKFPTVKTVRTEQYLGCMH